MGTSLLERDTALVTGAGGGFAAPQAMADRIALKRFGTDRPMRHRLTDS